AKRKGIAALTIRGISDHADKNKGSLEASTKDAVRRLAARNAATFLRMQLKSRHFRSALKQQVGSGQLALGLTPPTNDPAPLGLAGSIRLIETTIDDRLRELSPEFRLQPKGYKLPLPRIREVQYAGGYASHLKRTPSMFEKHW